MKNKLELLKEHWYAKNLPTIQTTNIVLVVVKTKVENTMVILVEVFACT